MTNKCLRGVSLLALLLTFCLPLLACAEGKTLTVGPSGSYATIQEAINYIDTQTDKTGWTIQVAAGDYGRFTVLEGLHGLTIQGSGTVNISVLDDSPSPVSTSTKYPDIYGVSIRTSNNVTINGLNFIAKKKITTRWDVSILSTDSGATHGANNLTVKNCSFQGFTDENACGLFIKRSTATFTVENCSFSNLKQAIAMFGDSTSAEAITVKGSSFTGCDYAVHGYWGGNKGGTVSFTNNTFTGTDSKRTKIVMEDQKNAGGCKVQFTNNKLDNAVVGLLNLRDAGEANDVLAANTFRKNSHYVMAQSPGTVDFYATYEAPAGQTGYWTIGNTGSMPAEDAAFVRAEIARANAAGEKRISFTTRDGQLLTTFTSFKDAVYWVTGPASAASDVPKTGDTAAPALWLALTALSAAAMLTLALRRRRV